jgi:hypothetical protein
MKWNGINGNHRHALGCVVWAGTAQLEGGERRKGERIDATI